MKTSDSCRCIRSRSASIPTNDGVTRRFPTSARAKESGLFRADVPPGVVESDVDRGRFRLGRDPLRSFEDDSENWKLETWSKSPGLGEPVAGTPRCVEGRATHGRRALSMPLELPRATMVFKRATVGEYRYITYDVWLPPDAPGRVRSLFFLKDKDGHWFQAVNGRPFIPGPDVYNPDGSFSFTAVEDGLSAKTQALRGPVLEQSTGRVFLTYYFDADGNFISMTIDSTTGPQNNVTGEPDCSIIGPYLAGS